MKAYYTIGVAMAAGFGLGVVAIHGLHAQAKAPVYLITEIDVKDANKYQAEFAPKAQATIKAAGAKFILIGGAGGAGAKPVTAMEGQPPKRITVQQWDSMEAMKKWYESADYQAALKIGKQYADFRRYAVEGTQQ
jgi:uncharacterized protein (DUF1330 family)